MSGSGSACDAPGCKNNRRTKPGTPFISFPLDPMRCFQWILHCRRKDLLVKTPRQIAKEHSICADHFTFEAFQTEGRKLAKDACPVLFYFNGNDQDSKPLIPGNIIDKMRELYVKAPANLPENFTAKSINELVNYLAELKNPSSKGNDSQPSKTVDPPASNVQETPKSSGRIYAPCPLSRRKRRATPSPASSPNKTSPTEPIRITDKEEIKKVIKSCNVKLHKLPPMVTPSAKIKVVLTQPKTTPAPPAPRKPLVTIKPNAPNSSTIPSILKRNVNIQPAAAANATKAVPIAALPKSGVMPMSIAALPPNVRFMLPANATAAGPGLVFTGQGPLTGAAVPSNIQFVTQPTATIQPAPTPIKITRSAGVQASIEDENTIVQLQHKLNKLKYMTQNYKQRLGKARVLMHRIRCRAKEKQAKLRSAYSSNGVPDSSREEFAERAKGFLNSDVSQSLFSMLIRNGGKQMEERQWTEEDQKVARAILSENPSIYEYTRHLFALPPPEIIGEDMELLLSNLAQPNNAGSKAAGDRSDSNVVKTVVYTIDNHGEQDPAAINELLGSVEYVTQHGEHAQGAEGYQTEENVILEIPEGSVVENIDECVPMIQNEDGSRVLICNEGGDAVDLAEHPMLQQILQQSGMLGSNYVVYLQE